MVFANDLWSTEESVTLKSHFFHALKGNSYYLREILHLSKIGDWQWKRDLLLISKLLTVILMIFFITADPQAQLYLCSSCGSWVSSSSQELQYITAFENVCSLILKTYCKIIVLIILENNENRSFGWSRTNIQSNPSSISNNSKILHSRLINPRLNRFKSYWRTLGDEDFRSSIENPKFVAKST